MMFGLGRRPPPAEAASLDREAAQKIVDAELADRGWPVFDMTTLTLEAWEGRWCWMYRSMRAARHYGVVHFRIDGRTGAILSAEFDGS